MADINDCIADRYLVQEHLGQGGMGAVYRVYDQRDGRVVALKRLSARLAKDRTVAELFEREFHTLSELAHPRIIEVYDYGIDVEGAYYTMELLGGQDVRALGKQHWRSACEVLRDVASSLAILHSRRLLHGDVSPRNVRCTVDGRAKLLDFGAMMPMGVAKRVVGTPPFISSELLNMQSLDGRSDLYALGALGYWLLTGRHAYPAQDVRQLRDLWRRPVAQPILLEPEIPEALSELIADLLQLNRNARPRSAGVVMERLCTIAGLPFEEAGEVAYAYLSTPGLVGREEPLANVRTQLVAALRGVGCTMIMSGPGGSGRSRFLDACVLEAKLLGLQVVRIDRSDSEQGNYAVAAALCRQLFELAPANARAAVKLHREILAHVIGAELAGVEAAGKLPERRHVLASLRDFSLSVARSLRLVIAVDDADGIDEASASLLMTIAQKTSHRALAILVTMDSEGEGSAALDLLANLARKLTLEPLTEAESEQLLSSMFGDANHVVTIAHRVHAIARGNPRATMQLATHLVDQGIARYEAGSFILPERLVEGDLPPSLAATLERRITRLGEDARELAHVLALTDPSELVPASYVELTGHQDRARTYRAVDQLVRAQVLEPQGERFRLSDSTWRGVLTEQLGPQERVALHARLAHVFEQTGTITRRSHHLMESEQPEAAIQLMLTQFLKDPNEPKDPLTDYVPGLIEQLERAAAAAEVLRMPAPLRIELKMKVAGASQFLGDMPRFLRIGPPLLAQLEQDSGLADYQALDPTLDSMARLTTALTQVQARYDATPEAARGLAPIDAIREVSRLCSIFTGMSLVAQDITLLERVPSLAPFVPLSPAVAIIQQFIEGTHALMQARDQRACAILLDVVKRLDAPDGAGLGQLYSKSLRLAALYIVGLAEASAGLPDAGLRVAELEREAGHRVNAQRVHATCHLMQGNVEAAASAQRRAALVMLQDGQQQRYPGTTIRPELLAYWLSDDLAGLKLLSERVATMAHGLRTWETLMHLTRCLYRQMQGDAPGALAALSPAIESVQPLRHRDWAWVAAAHVQVLVSLGHAEEAITLGLAHMEVCKQYELVGYRRVAQATAEALMADKRPTEAAQLADALLEDSWKSGVRGLALGALYELRARAAIALGDDAAFMAFAERCAAEYRPDRNPALAGRHQRLFRDAARNHPASIAYAVPAVDPDEPVSSMSSVYSRLLECEDAVARARCVLMILAEQVGAQQAYLFGLRDGELQLVCALPDGAAPEGLQAAVERCIAAELALGSEHKLLLASSPDVADSARASPRSVPSEVPSQTRILQMQQELLNRTVSVLIETQVASYFPVLLAATSEGQSIIAGIAALGVAGALANMPDANLLNSLASALLDNDDVDAATCML